MKTSLYLVSGLLALLLNPAARAADEHSATAPKNAHHDDHEHTELGEHMEKIGRAYKRLTKQAADAAQNADSLQLVQTIRDNAVAASKLAPEKAATLPEAKRPAFVQAYQKEMHDFIARLDQLQAAFKAGRNEEAAALVKQLKDVKDDGHKAFMKEKPKKK